MESVRDCDKGTGPSNSQKMKKSTFDEVDIAFLQWLNQKQAQGTSVSGSICAQKPSYFKKLWNWMASSMSPIDG
jgi:hypothetical protein